MMISAHSLARMWKQTEPTAKVATGSEYATIPYRTPIPCWLMPGRSHATDALLGDSEQDYNLKPVEDKSGHMEIWRDVAPLRGDSRSKRGGACDSPEQLPAPPTAPEADKLIGRV